MLRMHAGPAAADLKEFVVEGTSFNPTSGGILDLKGITKNLEVCNAISYIDPHNTNSL